MLALAKTPAIVERVPNLIFFCNKISHYHNCLYDAFIQYLKKADGRDPQPSTEPNTRIPSEESVEGLYKQGSQDLKGETHRDS